MKTVNSKSKEKRKSRIKKQKRAIGVVVRNFKYRVYPPKSVKTRLEETLYLCRKLYNAAIHERREAYRMCHKSVGYYEQQNQLPEIKETCPEYNTVYSQVLQNVLKRVQLAYEHFFDLIGQGIKVGLPRYQGKGRYNSICYPATGFSLHNDQLNLSKIGTLKVKLHRPVTGKVLSVTIKRESADRWYCVFSVEIELDKLPANNKEHVGLDLGVEYFAYLSNGDTIENPRFLRTGQKEITKAQLKFDKFKSKPKSKTKAKALKALQVAHRKIADKRRDFHHKQALNLVRRYCLIVVEDLRIANLVKRAKPKKDEALEKATGELKYLPNGASAKSGLNRSIEDCGWGSFVSILVSKAEYAGSQVLKVHAAYTSQTCPNCGEIRAKELSQRVHDCPDCGLKLHRDLAAARNILAIGLDSLGRSPLDAPAFTHGE